MYKFNRLSFGIKDTLAIFQQVMDTMLSELDFVAAYVEDILIKDEPHKEHKNVFNISQKGLGQWIQAERRKMQFLINKIGRIIDNNSRRLNPA